MHEPDPDDPVEILRVLPARFHDQFLREYCGAAAGAARQVGGYRQLHDVLRLWRFRPTRGLPGDWRRCRRRFGPAV